MAQIDRPSGITLELPDSVIVSETPSVRRRRGGGNASGPIGSDLSDLVDVLQTNDFAVIDTFALDAAQASPAGRRRGPTESGGSTASLRLEVGEHESAAILLDEGGFFSWRFPDAVTPTTPGVRRRRGAPAGPTRQLQFDFDLAPGTTDPHRRRGIPIIGGHIGKVTAVVLRFALPPIIGAVVDHLERQRLTRLVRIAEPDPITWTEFTDSAPAVSAGRRTKALLFIHGTFSSTRGGFGALGATPWGSDLLDRAVNEYDIVLGYDHKSLSIDPGQNAVDLLERLRALWPQGDVDFDVVCHSRGGLVYRSLVEKVIFAYPWEGRFGRAIFVAAANSGTELANPDNWERLADLYTNLAAAAARGLAIIVPGSLVAGMVLAEVIDGIGILVKTIVSRALQANDIPGIAAMWPAGPFIAEINSVEARQPTPASSTYFAVTSNFEPGLRQPDTEITERLLTLLRDGLVDQLMQTDNDMVVDIASMTRIDPTAGDFFDAKLDYGPNGAVYHTNYFHQQATTEALLGWLSLADDPAGRRRRGGERSLPATTPDFVVVSGQRRFDSALVDELNATQTPFIVVDRELYLRYAFRRDEFRQALELALTHGMAGAPLEVALNLHEDMASAQVQPGEAIRLPRPGAPPTSNRTVILNGDTPAGVSAASEGLTAFQLAAIVGGGPLPYPQTQQAAMPPEPAPPPPPPEPAMENGHGSGRGRRTRGGGRTTPTAAEPPETPLQPTPVTLNLGAWTDAEIELQQTASLVVTISRDAIELPGGAAAGLTAGAADPNKPLIVMALGRRNVRVSGKSTQTVSVPGAEPVEIYFDLVGSNLGEAQVDVVIRQAETPIAKIVLKPTVVQRIAAAGGRAEAAATVSTAGEPGTPRHQLYISQEQHGDDVTYRFHLDLLRPGEPPEPIEAESAPLKGSKEDYVRDLYKRIEDMWGDGRKQIDQFAEQMRAEGGSLWDELIPKSIKDALWAHRTEISFIQVYSDEPFIPWELVHMKEPGKRVLPPDSWFLAELGLVRWMMPGEDGVGCNRAPRGIRIRPGKVQALIPEYPAGSDWTLESAAAELQTLATNFGPVVRMQADFASVSAALGKGDFDLLHYAGHGSGDSARIGDEALILSVATSQGRVQPDVVLRASDIASHAVLSESPCADHRPMVVLNCCETGRNGYTLTSVGGMASAFLGAGAGVLVSPLWSVDDVAAADFARAFYESLKAGKTLAEAARDARTAIRQSGDQTWLAYTIYGEPTARLV
ncbi:MAG: CHAT domain-containing protein [bacterium]